MPCDEPSPIRWLFQNPSPYPWLPARYIWDEAPLMEGDLTPWAMEKTILSHGEGEQFTKVGALCPAPDQPPLRWRLEKELPPPPPPTVIVTGAVLAPPQPSHSSTTVLYFPGLIGRL